VVVVWCGREKEEIEECATYLQHEVRCAVKRILMSTKNP
jgi:hypothetical protein